MSEENENTQKHEQAADAAPAKQDKSGQTGQQAQQSREVTLAVTVNGETTSTKIKFHTPTLLAEVQKLDDAAHVMITAKEAEGKDPVALLEGTKAEAVKMLTSSIVKPEQIVAQFQHLVRFLVDHSNLKAVGVELVCTDDNGDTAGAGFVSTTPDCTIQQAVALVNCGDANLDEFVTKAKLTVPGRKGADERGAIVAPTPEEIRKLG